MAGTQHSPCGTTPQCLSAAWPLTCHFLTDRYVDDINTDNVLGTGGKLTAEYAALMQRMWFGYEGRVHPTALKRMIARFAEQFRGFRQHDAQELLMFLLDGIHEDLNRVKKKEYVEAEEANGRPDAVVAAAAWQKHLLRNRSVVVDCLHGQLKSKVVCPDCDRVSVTFDPFSILSIPLPKDKVRHIRVRTNAACTHTHTHRRRVLLCTPTLRLTAVTRAACRSSYSGTLVRGRTSRGRCCTWCECLGPPTLATW